MPSDLSTDPAVRLLLAATRLTMSDDDRQACQDIVAEYGHSIDWPRFMMMAYRHRMLPLLARNLRAMDLLESGKIPGHDIYRSVYLFHRARNTALYEEFARVLGAFGEHDIKATVRKGAYLAEAIYADVGLRCMHDLDLMVYPDDAGRAQELLRELGYSAGTYTADGKLVPNSRRREIFWQLHANHYPSMYRLTSDPHVNVFTVDMYKNLFLPDSGYSVPVSVVMDRSVSAQVGGVSAYVPAPEDMIVDLACQLFRESTTLRDIHRSKHQRLDHYWDIREFIAAAGTAFSWDELTVRCGELGVIGPVFHALAHLELLAPGTVPEQVLGGLSAKCESGPDILDMYGYTDFPSPRSWDCDFWTRTFAPVATLGLPASQAMF